MSLSIENSNDVDVHKLFTYELLLSSEPIKPSV